MNWSALDFDWNQVRALLATAEEGTMSAAARALGQTQPTVSRQIGALEERLGVVLLERGPRTTALTAAGLDLIEHVRGMADAAMRLSITASGSGEAVEGRVTITAGDMVSAYLLPDVLGEIATQAPGLVIDLAPSNEVRDLVRREADIAVRHVPPSEGVLIARRVRDSSARLYASPAYVARYGRPTALEELSRHAFVGLSPLERYLPVLAQRGAPLSPEQFRYTAANGVTMLALVRRGLGIGIVPAYAAAASDDLVPVLADQFQVDIPIWVVAHRELKASKRIRIVFDGIVDGLSKEARGAE